MNKHWSRYNFLMEIENNKFLLYNSFTNNLLEIDPDDYKILQQIEKGDYCNITDELLQELNENLILVENDDILAQKIKLARIKNRFKQDSLVLAIAPTIACNFACSYCFEEEYTSKGNTINADTGNNIISFISSHKNLQMLQVVWYGGEPLLAFDKIVFLTKRIQALSIDNYSAFMITNGYLLDRKKIEQLKGLCISKIQITIDGLSETHNKRRPHKTNKDSFQKIVNNIIELFEIYPEIFVNIRVDIDKNNADEFFELNSYLKNKITNPKLSLYPAYVAEYNNSCSKSSCILNRLDQSDFILKNGYKYPFEKYYYPQTSITECSARSENSYGIGPKGELYKCWCDVGRDEKSIGNVRDGITNTELYTRYMVDADPLYEQECLTCSYLPICNGGCPFMKLKNKDGDNLDVCIIQKDKLKEFFTLYYNKYK